MPTGRAQALGEYRRSGVFVNHAKGEHMHTRKLIAYPESYFVNHAKGEYMHTRKINAYPES